MIDINEELSVARYEDKYGEKERPKQSKEPEDPKIIRLSVSLINKMFHANEIKDYCPRQINETYILEKFIIKPSLSMLRGSYFETVIIGSGRKGEKITDLPRKQRPVGDRTAEHKRIDEQILLAKLVCEKHGIIINKDGDFKNVQVEHCVEWEDKPKEFNDYEIFLCLTADIISPIIYNNIKYPEAVIDLKLTADRDNVFGDYKWGDPKSMDHTQAILYSTVLRLPFFYLLFDYRAKDMGYKILPVNTMITWKDKEPKNEQDQIRYQEARLRQNELLETLRKAAAKIIEYRINGWYPYPTLYNCNSCPVRDDEGGYCDKYLETQEI